MKTAAHTALGKNNFTPLKNALYCTFSMSALYNVTENIYYVTKNQYMTFSSEPKSIHATGGHTRYNYEKLAVVNPSESAS